MSIPYAEVVGDPVAHSKSPLIHRFWLDALGLAGEYRRCHVRAAELPAYLDQRRADPLWRGCNVTVPHKQAVLALLDALEPSAAGAGAANIVLPGEERLIGASSDGTGFLEPLQPLLGRPHLFRMARLFGTGGAAVSIAHALAGEGFTLVVIGRDRAKAERLAAALPGEHHGATLEKFGEPTAFAFDDRAGVLDLVVNATTLGMAGQPRLPLDWSHVPPGAIVCDIVYAPLETPLLAEARAHGFRTVDGLHMLIGQAAVAFERFFGRAPPRERDAELRALLTA